MFGRVAEEFMEIKTIKDRTEIIVIEVRNAILEYALQFLLEHELILVLARVELAEKAEKGPRLRGFGLRIRRALHVEKHHLTDHAPDVPAREGIVTDEGDSLRRQARPADRHELVAGGLGYPGVEA